MNNKYDDFIIGTGVAGKKIAYALNDAGRDVAIADFRDFGGTCALRGCDPKRIINQLIRHKREYDAYSKSDIISGDLILKWENIIQYKDQYTKDVPSSTKEDLTKAGIDIFQDFVEVVGENKVKIAEDYYEVDNIVLATGYKPSELKIEGSKYLKTSDEVFEMENLTGDITIVGSGYIGTELSSMLNILGKEVTVIDHNETILSNFEKETVEHLYNYNKKNGINYKLNSEIESIEKIKDEEKYSIYFSNGEIRETGLVVHAAGREANLDNIFSEGFEVEYTNKGLVVNSKMQSIDYPNIYAAGDVADSGLGLTPVADAEAEIVSENILGNHIEISYGDIATVVFNIPSLASVGSKLGESRTFNMSEWYTTKIEEFESAFAKIFYDDNKITGAHLFGPKSEEVINLFTLAINQKIPISQIEKNLFSYPSFTNNIKYLLK